MYIYFKITDINSPAFQACKTILDYNKEVKKQIKEFIHQLGIPGSEVSTLGGEVVSFGPPAETDIPKGLRKSKQSWMKGHLVPDKRTKAGKKIARQLKTFRLKGAEEFMTELSGVNAGAAVGGGLSFGMGFTVHPEKGGATCCALEVWKAAKNKKDFHHPDGLIECNATEYEEYISYLKQNPAPQSAKSA